MDIEITYGYVKFISDTESPIYVLVCMEVMKEYFDEFKTIDEMIPELSMEYYNNFMVINCMPIKMLIVFKLLVKTIMTRKIVHIENIDEEINLLLLLCRLGNTGQIHKILKLFYINFEVWIRLLDEIFGDTRNFFYEEKRINICLDVSKHYPELDKAKYLSFYGIPYFDDLLGYGKDCYTYYNIQASHHFSFQRRIFDKISKSYYHLIAFGDKVLLFDRQDSDPIVKKRRSIRLKSSSSISLSSSSEDDEINLDIGIIKLPQEKKINNYAIDIIDVHFPDKIIPTQLVISGSYVTRETAFRQKYKFDYDRFKLDNRYSHIYDLEIKVAIEAYTKNHIYIPPTLARFESLLEESVRSSLTLFGSDSDSDSESDSAPNS
jgi:hypothetical protein